MVEKRTSQVDRVARDGLGHMPPAVHVDHQACDHSDDKVQTIAARAYEVLVRGARFAYVVRYRPEARSRVSRSILGKEIVSSSGE